MFDAALGGGALGAPGDDVNIITGTPVVPSFSVESEASVVVTASALVTVPPFSVSSIATSAQVPTGWRCPTLFESMSATLALLPKGRAWPANDGGSTLKKYLDWLAGLIATPRRDEWPVGYVQTGYYAAIGAVRNYVETRICDLRKEFWCATHSETHDLWMTEYGLPDPCDPFPDLCTKVAAIGGARCEYYAEIAARAGWTIACQDWRTDCGALAGCSDLGYSQAGGLVIANKIAVTVYIDESPAYVGAKEQLPFAGCMQAGLTLACAPDISPVQCILDRIVAAHVSIEYEIA